MKEDDIRKRDVFNKYLKLSAQDVAVFFKDKSSFVKSNHCLACQSKNIEMAFVKHDFQYDKCQNCGTFFVNPRPTMDMLGKFYADSPSTSFWVKEFFLPVAEVRRKKMFKPRAEFIADYFKNQSDLTIGDIGAGFGLLLEEYKKIRPQDRVIAIEPSIEMVEICQNKGIEVIPKTIETVEQQELFDVLVAFELFEHLFNPEFFLTKVFENLKSGGYFILTTLNGLGFDIQLLWKKSKSVSPPHHLNFFNPESTTILAESIGFKVIEKATPGKLDWDIIEGGLKHENINPGRFWETVSKHGSPTAKEELQNWIQKHNFSSHMRIILQKP